MTPQAAAIARGMLTPKEAAAEIPISVYSLLKWCRQKKLVCYHFGRQVRIKRTDLDRFIENCKG